MLNQKIVDTVKKLQIASRNMPKIWDGRDSIIEMKESGSKQWRQMEWMGFYFEFLCQKNFANIIDMPGKSTAIPSLMHLVESHGTLKLMQPIRQTIQSLQTMQKQLQHYK